MTRIREVAMALGALSVAAVSGCSTSNHPAPAAQATPQPSAQYSQAARPAAPELAPDMVRQVQVSLQQKNLYNGAIDGIWGPGTQAAVRSYQQSNGLNANGELDSPTLAALDLAPDGTVPASGSSTTGSGQRLSEPVRGFPDHPAKGSAAAGN